MQLVEANPGGATTFVSLCERASQQLHLIGDTRHRTFLGQRPIERFIAGLRKQQQHCGQVAAVDRRHVPGFERAQAERVDPIQKMATMTRQSVHAVQGSLETTCHLVQTDPAKIARGDDGQQIQAEVGR